MIKVFLWEDGLIKKYEPIEFSEVILNYNINDSIVNDISTWEITKLQDSTQGKKRVEELQSKKELDEIEKAELEYLLPKTHMVNVTTEDGKKHYVIHEILEWIDFDINRWDMKFSSKEKAQEYIDLITNSQ